MTAATSSGFSLGGVQFANASQAQKVLLTIPDAMIQRVSGAERHVLHTGPVELCEVAGPGTNGDRIRVQSPNGLVSFPVHPDTPALKAADLVYSFTPETSFDDPGNARGAIFVLALSQTTSRDLVKALELVLVQCSALGAVAGVALLLSDAEVAEATSRPGIQVPLSFRLVNAISSFSDRLSSGLVQAGAKGAELLRRASERYAERATPSERPAQVPEGIRGAAATIKAGAQVGVAFTAAAGAAVAGAARELGMVAATKIKESEITQRHLQNERLRGAIRVGGATLAGVADVYAALAEATRLVLSGAADAVSQGVTHRYGPAAGTVTRDALDSAQSLATIGRNVRVIAVRGVAKHAAAGIAAEIADVPIQPGTSNSNGTPPAALPLPSGPTTASPEGTSSLPRVEEEPRREEELQESAPPLQEPKGK